MPELIANQKGCDICAVSCSFSVDHNHKTGAVRGLLCGSCNRALGLFHDNPALLRKAATYLEEGDAK